MSEQVFHRLLAEQPGPGGSALAPRVPPGRGFVPLLSVLPVSEALTPVQWPRAQYLPARSQRGRQPEVEAQSSLSSCPCAHWGSLPFFCTSLFL